MNFPTNWILGAIKGLDWRAMRLPTRDQMREFVENGIRAAEAARLWDEAGTYERATRRFLQCHKEGHSAEWRDEEWSRPEVYSMVLYDLQSVAHSLSYGDSITGDEWVNHRTAWSVIAGLIRTVAGLMRVDPKIDPRMTISFIFDGLVETRPSRMPVMG